MALDPRDQRLQRLLRERELYNLDLSEFPGYQRKDVGNAAILTPIPGKSLKERLAEKGVDSQATSGMGPVASPEKYGSMLEAIQARQAEQPSELEPEPEQEGAVSKLGLAAPTAAPKPSPAAQEKKDQFTNLLDRLTGKREEAKAEREQAMRRADIGELASLVGRSLAQIGAAAQGMRTGVDLSNAVQSAMVDWDKRRQQALDVYGTNIREIDQEQALIARQMEREEDKATRIQLANQQEQLERDKMKQQERLKTLEIELDNQAKTFKALADKDEKAAKFIQAQAKIKASRLTNQLKPLQDAEGVYAAWRNAGGKDKKKLVLELRELAGRSLPAGATEAQKEKVLGLFDNERELEPEELMKLVRDRRSELEEGIISQEEISEGLRQAMPALAKEEQPAAAAPAPVPAAPTPGQDSKVSDYAKLYTNGDYAKAKAILIGRGYTPKE